MKMTEGKRLIRPVERQPMREWLIDHLENDDVPGCSWTDRNKGEFHIKWCHGSRHGWSMKDADLFERWAKHTGRFSEKTKDPKKWKANFRCALNSRKDIDEITKKGQLKGASAYRVYRMKGPIIRDRKPRMPALPDLELSRPTIKVEKNKSPSECSQYPETDLFIRLQSSIAESKFQSELPNFDKILPEFEKLATNQSPYAVKIAEDHHHNTKGSRRGHILTKKGVIVGLSDQTLALLLGVGSNLLWAEKFNVKIEEVRFVGFPLGVEDDGSQTGHKISSFNIAFALHANSGPWIVSCYQDLAKQLTVALKHEEKRVQYLSTQAKVMSTVHNEVTSLPEDSFESPFETILKKSELAKQLSQIYDSLNEYGVVHFFLNNWIEINFCLPHRLHYLQTGHKFFKMEPEAIQKCLKSLRPYHGMLLLQEENMLLESLPVDCTPALSRLVQVANPIRSLQKLAVEADLSLFQVFQLVCHLVYWAKAIIIYPLCETNVYVLSPHANTNLASPLAEAFTQQFPGRSLVVEMSEFSFPSQLRKNQNALSHPEVQDLKVRMVVWMLQRHLLIQLHTYIFFVPAVKKKKSKEMNKVHIVPEDWSSIEGGLQRSPSFSDAASVASDESYTLSTPSMMFAQLSKSPSSEFTSDNGPHASDENKMYWMMQESVFTNLTIEEKDCIMSVPASKNMDDLRMFARLFPYFSGKSHIEEIMYFENLLRSQLLTLLDKFHEVLILCTYQDPATMLSSSLR